VIGRDRYRAVGLLQREAGLQARDRRHPLRAALVSSS
jgi:hypothetical protein